MATEFSASVDTIPGLVWTAHPDGNVDFFNQFWSEYTGLGVDEAHGTRWQNAIHPADLPDLRQRWQSILTSGEPGSVEVRLRRFDGEYRWFGFRARPLTDASGHIVKWCGMGIDIEGGRLTEEARRTRDEHSRSIADSIPAHIAFMTPTGEVESVNRHVVEYLGATLEELKGRSFGDPIHPNDRPLVVSAWKRAVETGEPYSVEHRTRGADGTYRWFHSNGLPLKDGQGNVSRWYVLQTDIEDRKQAEALLAGEMRLLRMVVDGHPMEEILEGICLLVEYTVRGGYCSVVLVDPSGRRLEHGAAPSLPASFITSIVGRPVNVDSGPCAMASSINEQVIAADLTSETRWAEYDWCPMALAHGLQACWSTPISSSTGTILGAFAIYYDEPRTPTAFHQRLIEQFTQIASIVIERAQSNLALELSDARKAAIMDSALDCIVTIDHEGCISEFNPAAELTFGYRRDDVLGKQLAEVIIPPSLRERHQQGLARHLKTGETSVMGKRVEMTAMRADGSEFPVELAITRIPIDGPPSFTGYLRDITARKQSEEELRRSEAFLAKAQQLSSTGSYSWRVATNEIKWSEQLYRIFEFDQGMPVTLDLIGTRVHPEDIPSFHDFLNRACRGDSNFEYEHRLQMADQSVKYLHMVAHAIRDQEGRLEYIGAVQDVTPRRLAAEELSRARTELAHVVRVTSLGVLTASIAHEVSQPLSGIITNASTCLRMLAADPPNVDGARETARRTIRDGNRASDVITRLRALFGKKDTTTDLVDLNSATREVIALSLSELQRNRVILRAEFADDLPLVMGDRVQIQQVILNLVRNASDAMNDVDNRPRQLAIRTERDEDDHVRLTVQDAGVGFKSQDAERFFEAFYTTKSDGMGIGLSVSRSIIERHHGRLWAAPNDGPGATFAFSIPCRPRCKWVPTVLASVGRML